MNRFLVSNAICLLSLLGVLLISPLVHAGDAEVIQRNGVTLKLDGANVVIEGALKKAAEMKLNVNIAVVDAGGHLIAFARMDEARPASIYTAMSKAETAALKRGDTGILGAGEGPPDIHLNLAVENAAAMSGGKFTTLKGGIAIVVDGQVVGGIGVGGATGSQDAEIARAGLMALEAEIENTK